MSLFGSNLTTNEYLIFHALPILNDAHYNLIDEFPEGLLDESPGLLQAPNYTIFASIYFIISITVTETHFPHCFQ